MNTSSWDWRWHSGHESLYVFLSTYSSDKHTDHLIRKMILMLTTNALYPPTLIQPLSPSTSTLPTTHSLALVLPTSALTIHKVSNTQSPSSHTLWMMILTLNAWKSPISLLSCMSSIWGSIFCNMNSFWQKKVFYMQKACWSLTKISTLILAWLKVALVHLWEGSVGPWNTRRGRSALNWMTRKTITIRKVLKFNK